MQCDPKLIPNQPNYDMAKYPCDGGIQFQHLFYEPTEKDDGKQLSCALDEDYDNRADYSAAPVNLRINQRPLGISLEEKINIELLQVEFKDAWGEAHLHAGKYENS